MKNPDSHLFEEAYFIVRRGAPDSTVPEEDMVREAQRIVSECGAYPAPRRRGGRALSFLAGAASAGALIGGAAALMTVF